MQNSGPSGSLFLSRKALASSTPCRFIPAHRQLFLRIDDNYFSWPGDLIVAEQKFPTFESALEFVFKIRTVVSDTEFTRMNREHCRRLAWQMDRDAKTIGEKAPTVQEVAAEVSP